MAKPERRHRPSKPSNAPVNGFLYFVLPETRMTRRWDMDCLPVPSHWKQVSLDEYLEFRKETKANFTIKHLRAMAALYKSNQLLKGAVNGNRKRGNTTK